MTNAPQHIEDALNRLKEGKCVAMPTETVYGLACDASSDVAVEAVYQLKGRPSHNPLIVHVADKKMAQRYVEWNDIAETLASHFWPGALTLVLPLKPDATISEKLTAGGNTLAIRCPKHPVAQALLKACDGGLAAPSANRSGKISPTLSHHVKAEFPDEELLILEGGACEVGIESTVVLCDEQSVRILRSGIVTASQIEALGIELDISMQQQTDQPLQSPGLLTSHYAPSLPLRINAMEVESHEALIAFGPQPLSGAARTLNLSSRGDLDEAAVHLFATMRALDDSKFSGIAVMPIPNQGIGVAINDRLRRAAADREA